MNLNWEVIHHHAYSLDLAPSDYHFFRSLENALRDTLFKSQSDIENLLSCFFESKPTTFYRAGMLNLPERWAKVIAFDGNYFNDDLYMIYFFMK